VIANLGLRWTLTIVFVACIGLYGREMIRARIWQQRSGWSLHVLMAVAMVAMVWPAGMSIPVLLYVLGFSAAALYYVYLRVFGPQVDHAVYHTVMMAAMVAMAVVMGSATLPGMASAEAMGAGHDMAMPGAGPMPATAPGPSPAWATVLCGVGAAGFLGAAIWWLIVLIRRKQPTPAYLLMALGMGTVFAVMAT
jgi:Domain of unknown function (DUF5134)